MASISSVKFVNSNEKKQEFKNIQNYKTILSGGVAGMISKTCTAPLERVQILNQTGASQIPILRTLNKIWMGDSIRGLWKGNVVNCIRVFPHKSILFTCNETLLKYFPSRQSSAFITGACSGLIATAVTYPLDVIRTMLAGTFNRSITMTNVMKIIMREKGAVGLYAGLMVTCAGAVPYEATRIGVYNVVRPYIPVSRSNKKEPHAVGKMLNGAFAGACAGFATYPSDTVRRMLQVQSANGMQKYNGFMDCVAKTLKTQGVFRFYSGLSVKLVRVMPDAAILFLAYETVKSYFENSNNI